jgi:hypothetical protein
MAFDRIAEKAIREAMREGKFDNLPNAGRPIDLEDYFKAPEDMRAAYAVLKGANVLPEEMELTNEIARLERDLAAETDPSARRSLRRMIEARRLRLSLQIDRNRQSR